MLDVWALAQGDHLAAAIGISCSALPLLASLYTVIRQQSSGRYHYRDAIGAHSSVIDDGLFTRASFEEFFAKSPGNLITLCAVAALLSAIIQCILDAVVFQRWLISYWAHVIAWTFIFSQSALLRLQAAARTQHSLACWLLLSSTCLCFSLIWDHLLQSDHIVGQVSWIWIHDCLNLIALVLSLVIAFVCARIPRLPNRYWKGKLVDRQFNASLFERSDKVEVPEKYNANILLKILF